VNTKEDNQAGTEKALPAAVLLRLILTVTLGSDTADVSAHPRVVHPSLILWDTMK
jgi:hypothetical protein